MTVQSTAARSGSWQIYVGAAISATGALIAIVLLALVFTEPEIMSGIDPAILVNDPHVALVRP